MNQKVSIIIPTYNSAEYIAETLDSAFAQTYKNCEIIVIDDGSTDNTKEVLQSYMSKIKYIYKENGGVSSARNVGIENAEGEYIAFLDSDDIWLPEKLEKQMERFKSEPDLGLVYSDCIRFNENGIEQSKRIVNRYFEGNIFIKLLEGYVLPTSTVVVKRSCFSIADHFNESLMVSEDYDMWLRISKHYNIGYAKGPLVKYRVRNNGLARSNIDRAYGAQLAVLNKAMNDIDGIPDKSNFLRNRFFKFYFNWGVSLLDIDNFADARNAFLKATKIKPYSIKNIIYYLFATLRAIIKH
jgi:glycosyltransferase involved in cell wall biosynthesis